MEVAAVKREAKARAADLSSLSEDAHFDMLLREVGAHAAWLYFDRLPSTRRAIQDMLFDALARVRH